MFTEEQLDELTKAGSKGLSLRSAASALKLTYIDFMEEYEENKRAQLAYELGQAELELRLVTVAEIGMKEGDAKKFEYFTKSVLNMDGKSPNKVSGSGKAKQNTVPDILLNPDLLSEFDDDELQRKILAKQDEEAAKKPIEKVEVEDYKEDKKEKQPKGK